jgi:hypothetical protein
MGSNPLQQQQQVGTLGASLLPGTASGIERIDTMLAGGAGLTIGPGDAADAVGAIQDLLAGLGVSSMPVITSSDYGQFGPRTGAAVTAFRQRAGLSGGTTVDEDTLQKLIAEPPIAPHASQIYMTLLLHFSWNAYGRILRLVAMMESAGKFGALNLNTDRAGLSFGVLQWAQRPGGLAEILHAMQAADSEKFANVFGAGDNKLATGLMQSVNGPSGGVDAKTGIAVNPSFNLVAEPWVTRFRQAAAILEFQQTQVQLAMSSFQKAAATLQRFAPLLQSERSVGFMLDVTNQFGQGGAHRLYTTTYRDGMSEMDALNAIAQESIAELPAPEQTGVRSRRDFFLHTPYLSDQPFASA